MSPARNVLNLPRQIKPELIEPGDKIRVLFKRERGVLITHEGVVSHRADKGHVRYLYTDDGATLTAWDTRGHNLTVILLDRPPAEQTPMFDMEEFIANA